MLDRPTRIRWTQDVVAFLNGDTDGTLLGRDPVLARLLAADSKWVRLAPPEKLRRELDEELRWFAGQLDTKRALARKEQWPTEDRAARIRVSDKAHRTHGDFWLGKIPELELVGFTYDEHGRIVVHPGGELPPTTALLLTVAELHAADSPVEVKVCQYEKCTRLFVHELHGKRRPKEYCRVQHSVAQRKLNMKRPKRKRK